MATDDLSSPKFMQTSSRLTTDCPNSVCRCQRPNLPTAKSSQKESNQSPIRVQSHRKNSRGFAPTRPRKGRQHVLYEVTNPELIRPRAEGNTIRSDQRPAPPPSGTKVPPPPVPAPAPGDNTSRNESPPQVPPTSERLASPRRDPTLHVPPLGNFPGFARNPTIVNRTSPVGVDAGIRTLPLLTRR